MYGIDSHLIAWISDFLFDRSIAVRVDGYLSDIHSVNAGVPQGSVLSPILFLLYINDLLSSLSCDVHSYADDTYVSASFGFGKPLAASWAATQIERAKVANILQDNLRSVDEWGKINLVKSTKQRQSRP